MFSSPDYCFVTSSAETLQLMEQQLERLVQLKGVYYEVFDKKDSKGEKIIAVFFQSSVIDVLAEVYNIKHRLSSYNCLVDFKAYAADSFEKFNGR